MLVPGRSKGHVACPQAGAVASAHRSQAPAGRTCSPSSPGASWCCRGCLRVLRPRLKLVLLSRQDLHWIAPAGRISNIPSDPYDIPSHTHQYVMLHRNYAPLTFRMDVGGAAGRLHTLRHLATISSGKIRSWLLQLCPSTRFRRGPQLSDPAVPQ